MPYIAQRRMRVMGTDYAPGEHVPAHEVGARSLRSMLGRGHIVEVDESAYERAEAAKSSGGKKAKAGG